MSVSIQKPQHTIYYTGIGSEHRQWFSDWQFKLMYWRNMHRFEGLMTFSLAKMISTTGAEKLQYF